MTICVTRVSAVIWSEFRQPVTLRVGSVKTAFELLLLLWVSQVFTNKLGVWVMA